MLTTLLALVARSDASAQTQLALDSIAPRTTVKIWSSELRRPVTAVVLDWRFDSLHFQRKTDPPRNVSRASITRLDVSVPRTRAEGARFFGIWFLAQGALGGLGLELFAAALGAEFSPLSFSVPVSAAIGGTVGVVGGAIFPGRRWRTVVRPARQDRNLHRPNGL